MREPANRPEATALPSAQSGDLAQGERQPIRRESSEALRKGTSSKHTVGKFRNKSSPSLRAVINVCLGSVTEQRRNMFFSVLETGNLGPSYRQGWFLLRPQPLACVWLPSCGALTWSFLCVWVSLECPLCPDLLIRTPVRLD